MGGMTRKLRGTGLLAVPLMAVAALLGGIMPASAATGSRVTWPGRCGISPSSGTPPARRRPGRWPMP
jgi:hypothetical protein